MNVKTIALLSICLVALSACGACWDLFPPEPPPPNDYDDRQIGIAELLEAVGKTNAEIISPDMYDADMPRMTSLLNEIAASNADMLASSERFVEASEALVAKIEARQTGAEPPRYSADCIRDAERKITYDGATE